MPTSLIKHQFDKTGANVNNLIENELHNNIDSLARVILPVHGRFYTESLVVKESLSSVALERNTDYIITEYDQQTSLLIGKEICNSILIINDTLGSDFKISYQTLGGDFGYSNENLLAVLQDKILPNMPVEWVDIREKPVEFPAKHHLHDIDEIYGFEYVVKELVKIKQAIETNAFPSFQSLLSYCETTLTNLKNVMLEYLDNNMVARIDDFKSEINIAFFKLDALENLSAARELDGYSAGARSVIESDIVTNKYMTIESLIGLKKILFESLLEKQKTGLGLTKSTFSLPVRQTLFDMPIGGITSLITKRAAHDAQINIDLDLYPTAVQDFTEISLKKLSTNNLNNGGLFIAYDPANMGEYSTALETTNQTEVIVWKKKPTSFDEDPIREKFEKHIVDYTSPHGISKFNIGLGLVEDLSTVTDEEILALRSTHKYITFDGLLKFIEAYVIANNTDLRPQDKPSPDYLIDNCVVVYSPAGQGCPTETANNDCVDPPVLPVGTQPPVITAPPPVTTIRPPSTTTMPPATTNAPTPTTTSAPYWKVLLEKSKPRGDPYTPYQVFSDPEDTTTGIQTFTNQQWSSESELLTFIDNGYLTETFTIANHSSILLAADGWKSIKYSNSSIFNRPMFYAKKFFAPTPTLAPNTNANDPVLQIVTIAANGGYFTLRAENLTIGEIYVIECWGKKNPSSTFTLNPSFPNTTMVSSTDEDYHTFTGYRKLLFAGSSSIAHSYKLTSTLNENQVYEYYCVMYKQSNTNSKYTSNTHQCVFSYIPPTPAPTPSAEIIANFLLSPLGDTLEYPHNGTIQTRLLNVDTTQKYIIDYYVRTVQNNVDSGYILNKDLSNVLKYNHFRATTTDIVYDFPKESLITAYNTANQYLPSVTVESLSTDFYQTNFVTTTVMIYIKFYAESNPSVVYSTFGATNGMVSFTVFN